jgi:AAA15 family ATPase/GTPase
MISRLKIENYRNFQSFELTKLGKINLLVGLNNSGKTSILETLSLLFSPNNINPLLQILRNRGEFAWVEFDDGQNQEKRQIMRSIKAMTTELYVRHLFHSHNVKHQKPFSITASRNNNQDKFEAIVSPNNNLPSDIHNNSLNLILKWTGTKESQLEIPLSGNLAIFPPNIQNLIQSSSDSVEIIYPKGIDVDDLINMFDEISLTPKEKIVIDALKILEPNLERIAINPKSSDSEKGGFKILQSNYDQPIPIGSMGDGIWQIINIVLVMLTSPNSIILLDEIDSGLHFTTLLKMWKLVWKIANELNIQVFATTHNSDCWRSLAQLIDQEIINQNNEETQVTIHRIDPHKQRSTIFNQDEILIALEREIEVR